MNPPTANDGAGLRALRPWLLAALVLAFDVAVLVHLHDRFWWPPDDGAYAHPAERMLQGEVLHRDVHEAHPALHFVNEAALALFGNRLVSLRYPLVAVAAAQALLVFLLLLPAPPSARPASARAPSPGTSSASPPEAPPRRSPSSPTTRCTDRSAPCTTTRWNRPSSSRASPIWRATATARRSPPASPSCGR